MEDFFTQPSQQAIEVTHPRGSESVFINPSALSLTSRQLLLVLCGELELCPDDVFLTAPQLRSSSLTSLLRHIQSDQALKSRSKASFSALEEVYYNVRSTLTSRPLKRPNFLLLTTQASQHNKQCQVSTPTSQS
jgi:hypothetical protein